MKQIFFVSLFSRFLGRTKEEYPCSDLEYAFGVTVKGSF